MPIGILFWVLMVLWLIFGVWGWWPRATPNGPVMLWYPLGNHFIIWVLFFLIGWKLFGFIVQ